MESMFTHREGCGSNLTLKSPLLNTTKVCFLLTVPLSQFEESSASHDHSQAKLTEVPPSFTCTSWGRWSLSHRGKEERTEGWSSCSDLLASGGRTLLPSLTGLRQEGRTPLPSLTCLIQEWRTPLMCTACCLERVSGRTAGKESS